MVGGSIGLYSESHGSYSRVGLRSTALTTLPTVPLTALM